jgi:hypothetical protein
MIYVYSVGGMCIFALGTDMVWWNMLLLMGLAMVVHPNDSEPSICVAIITYYIRKISSNYIVNMHVRHTCLLFRSIIYYPNYI